MVDDVQALRERATRLYALALKARDSNLDYYAVQLEELAAEAFAHADRLAPFSALRYGTTVRWCLNRGARTCHSRERRQRLAADYLGRRPCGRPTARTAREERAKFNLAVVGPDIMRRLVQSD
jgi:hypothetical protein